MKVLVINDLHLCNPGFGGTVSHYDRLFEKNWASLQPVIERCDLLLILGDIAQAESRMAYKALDSFLSKLSCTILAVPGNHDNATLMRKELRSRVANWPKNSLSCSVHFKDWSAIALDSSVPGRPHGEINQSDLHWFSNQLEQANGNPVLVGSHHPPVDTEISFFDEIGLKKGGPELMRRMAEYSGKIMIASGHHHIGRVSLHGEILVYMNATFSGPPIRNGLWNLTPKENDGRNGAGAISLTQDEEFIVQPLYF